MSTLKSYKGYAAASLRTTNVVLQEPWHLVPSRLKATYIMATTSPSSGDAKMSEESSDNERTAAQASSMSNVNIRKMILVKHCRRSECRKK